MHVGLVARSEFDTALDLANDLYEAGVSVTLYLSYEHALKVVDAPGQSVKRLYEVGLLPKACKVRLLRLPRMRDPRSMGVFYKLSKNMRDDGINVAHILVTPGELWFAVLTCLLRDTPVTSTMIVPNPNFGETLPTFIVWGIYKLVAFGSDTIIVHSEDQLLLVQKLYGVSSNKVVYVPLGARKTSLRWSTKKVPEDPGTLLFFGRADPHKGLEYLVRAQPIITRYLPHARIVIVARGKELDRCKSLIEDGNRFEIHDGFVPGNVMATFFQRASLVVLPYLSAASSGVLLTAYVFGKPVVATNISGLSEYVEDGVTGLLVSPTDVEQLAEAIVRLLSSDTLRHQMGKSAKDWVHKLQKLTKEQTVMAYEKAIALHKL